MGASLWMEVGMNWHEIEVRSAGNAAIGREKQGMGERGNQRKRGEMMKRRYD